MRTALLPSALAPARAGRRLAVPPVTSGARSLSWMSRGACQQADPELFFPAGAVTGPAARQAEVAKAVCGRCAVRANCLSYALEAMPEGIWGGTTLDERRAARRRPFRRWASTRYREHGKHDDDRGKRNVRRARCGAAGPARQDSVMSLPASQRRALIQIEKTLADDHPGLGPLFAIFTGLTGREAMPVTERVTARPWRWQRRMWPRVVTVVGLAMAMGVLVAISVMLPGPQECAHGHGHPRRGAHAVSPDRAPGRLRDPAKQAKQYKPERAQRATEQRWISPFRREYGG